MQVIYGKIRSVDEKNRLISILIKNKIEYFYLSRTQMKKYNPYLSEGLYVYFRCTDHKKIHHHVTCYDITSFIKVLIISLNIKIQVLNLYFYFFVIIIWLLKS